MFIGPLKTNSRFRDWDWDIICICLPFLGLDQSLVDLNQLKYIKTTRKSLLIINTDLRILYDHQ